MTRTGAAKSVNKTFAIGRLKKAMAFHRAIDMVTPFYDEIGDVDVIGALVVLSAIAYADAVTGVIIGKINQRDHSAAPKLLREALGSELPRKQQTNFERILGTKDEVHYGARPSRLNPVETTKTLQEFADWTQEVLAQRGIVIPGRES